MSEGVRRLVFGNLFVRLTGGLVVCGAVTLWPDDISHAAAITWLSHSGSRLATYGHLIFNAALALLFLPTIGYLVAGSERILPDRRKQEAGPKYLDEMSLKIPSIALSGATREALRILDIIEAMLRQAFQAQSTNDAHLCTLLSKLDDNVDTLHEATKLYIVRLQREGLDHESAARSAEVISFTTNLEHVGDIIDRSLRKTIQKKARNKLQLSPAGEREISAIFEQTLENLQMAESVFLTRDVELARCLVQAKADIRKVEKLSSEKHFERLAEDCAESIQTSSIHLDILRDLKRINAHIAGIAYSILDRIGQLDDNRLRKSPF